MFPLILLGLGGWLVWRALKQTEGAAEAVGEAVGELDGARIVAEPVPVFLAEPSYPEAELALADEGDVGGCGRHPGRRHGGRR